MAGRFVAVVVVAAILPWFVGRFWRRYQELVRAGWERAGRLEREQRLVAEQARSRERARIAQDMHDVLGHDLSLIALPAGALKLDPGLDESQRAAAGESRARAAAPVERLGEGERVGPWPHCPSGPANRSRTTLGAGAGVHAAGDGMPFRVVDAAHTSSPGNRCISPWTHGG